MRYRVFLALAWLALVSSPALAGSGLTLNAKTVIVERPDAPGPVKKAIDDLANDMQKVFGTRPRIVPQSDAMAIEIAVPTGGAAESFAIAARGNHVVLSGADMRGTLYAIYTFSHDWLGVDPMYYWTDKAPAKKAGIVIPAALSKAWPAPLFKYRGFFINDEDMLTGWAPGEKSDGSGIARPVMDKIFETILRLRAIWWCRHWTFPTDPQMKWAGRARPDPHPASCHPGGHECGALAGRRALQPDRPSRNSGAGLEQCGRQL